MFAQSWCILLQAFSAEMTGAMTITFIQATRAAFNSNKKISYQEIMNHMHHTLRQAHKSGRFSGIFRIFHRRILQVGNILFIYVPIRISYFYHNTDVFFLNIAGPTVISFCRFRHQHGVQPVVIQSWMPMALEILDFFFKLFLFWDDSSACFLWLLTLVLLFTNSNFLSIHML